MAKLNSQYSGKKNAYCCEDQRGDGERNFNEPAVRAVTELSVTDKHLSVSGQALYVVIQIQKFLAAMIKLHLFSVLWHSWTSD